jgi:uncharacterized protein (DUF885 family)
VLACLTLGACSPATETPVTETAAERLHALLDEHWARAEQEQVFFRTDPDGFRPNGKLPEFSAEARARRQTYNEEIIERLSAIDESELRGQDRISYKLFRYERETERDSYAFYDHRFPITALSGYHSYFAYAPANMAFDTVEDYEKFLVTLADFPRYNAENIALLQEGIDTGYTHYCESIVGYEQTISELIVDNVGESALYGPFAEFPTTVPADHQAELRERGATLLAGEVMPALRELYTFFTEQYQPNCRTTVGITSLEGGDDYYAYLIRYFTTTDMSPAEIHELGLSESRRIRVEMEAIIEKVGFEGSFKAFLDFLRTDPRFYASDSQELLEKVAFITKKMDGQMPRFFGRLARNTYEIRGVEGRGAYYVGADGRTAGVYFVNVSDLQAQPLYNLEALSLHEAVPGHHHQGALARELDLPEFRRTVYHSAFGEGWGLYSEALGQEAGFYTDPYSDFGRLTYEMWRANRLVVDTGMHAFDWSRRQAIDFLLENSALTEPEVIAEVDRYITWPAQALSYKIGELRIKALRAKAEAALGQNFDIRAFHDVVVGNGSVPIAVLEEIFEEWLSEQ